MVINMLKARNTLQMVYNVYNFTDQSVEELFQLNIFFLRQNQFVPSSIPLNFHAQDFVSSTQIFHLKLKPM